MPSFLQQAIAFHQKGNLPQAERFYGKALVAEPANFALQHMVGVLHYQQGNFDEAISHFDHAIALNPIYAAAHYARGVAYRDLHRFEDALRSLDYALKLEPQHFEVIVTRSNVLRDLGSLEDALADTDKAAALRPRHHGLLYNRGTILLALKRYAEAITVFDEAVTLNANHSGAWLNRGSALLSLSRFNEALTSFERAIAVAPTLPIAHFSRGIALRALKRLNESLVCFEAAISFQPDYIEADIARAEVSRELGLHAESLRCYDQALAINPLLPELHYNRAISLLFMGCHDSAIAGFDRAIALKPDYSDAWSDRGAALRHLKRYTEALASFDRAIAITPDHVGVLNNRGVALWDLGRIEEANAMFGAAIAIAPNYAVTLRNRGGMLWTKTRALAPALADLERALALDPDAPGALGEVIYLKLYAADWRDFSESVAAINASVRAGKQVIQPFQYQALSSSPDDLFACAKIYAESNFPVASAVLSGMDRRPGPIRVGYVCGEFRSHATSDLSVGVYENHDKQEFKIIAFDNGFDDGSPVRRRMANAFDAIIDISKLNDHDAAMRIAAEDIDILVNLNGYYGNHRTGVFAKRPARLQVNFLGFPGTLGTSYMDYIIADAVVLPKHEYNFFTEKVVVMPDTYQPNDALRPFPSASTRRTDHGLPERTFVFCHFNHGYKILPDVFDCWMRILHRTGNSVLWLLQTTEPFAENIRREAKTCGIASSRIVFAPVAKHEDHLARFTLADLFLDSTPCNAHTTASDALWMGLPLLTCRGSSFAGRVAASVLQAVGLPELIAENMEDYENRAVRLAHDFSYMMALRQKLAAARTTASLFNTARYTRHLEAAYKEMFSLWRKGKKPHGFSVPPC